jgi:hypothetical protein
MTNHEIPSSERPLVQVGKDKGYQGNPGCMTIYANREGLQKLYEVIGELLGPPKAVQATAQFSAFAGHDWHHVRISLSTQADFEVGEGACGCGCQKQFESVEAAYQADLRAQAAYTEIEIDAATTLGVLPPGTQILIICDKRHNDLVMPYWSDHDIRGLPVAGVNVQDDLAAWISCRVRIPKVVTAPYEAMCRWPDGQEREVMVMEERGDTAWVIWNEHVESDQKAVTGFDEVVPMPWLTKKP